MFSTSKMSEVTSGCPATHYLSTGILISYYFSFYHLLLQNLNQDCKYEHLSVLPLMFLLSILSFFCVDIFLAHFHGVFTTLPFPFYIIWGHRCLASDCKDNLDGFEIILLLLFTSGFQNDIFPCGCKLDPKAMDTDTVGQCGIRYIYSMQGCVIKEAISRAFHLSAA